MTHAAVLAIDVGAESGRGVLVRVVEGGGRPRLEHEEVHRFANLPVELPDGLHWDVPALFRGVRNCLGQAVGRARALGCELRSVGVDAWGVDFALLGASGELLGLPRSYRDPLAREAFERTVRRIGRERLYRRTGIQFLPFNTIHQLVGLRDREPRLLDAADRLAFVPDLLHEFLSGEPAVESTIASTSQLLSPHTRDWDFELCAELDLPAWLFRPLSTPGTVVGPLRASLRAATGAPRGLEVVLPASHDTASAVMGVPAAEDCRWAYLSSGTWSLLGIETTEPILTDAACAASFTNEWGADGRFRFLKNITGLWLVQECRRAFAAAGDDLDYAELTRLADAAGPSRTRLDVADPLFLEPGDMPGKVSAFACRTGQPEPHGPGALVRSCLDGLAHAYAETLDRIEELSGRRIDVLHVVGGGARNELLNRLTAEAADRRVAVGPVEATALGNALVQARADGLLAPDVRPRDLIFGGE